MSIRDNLDYLTLRDGRYGGIDIVGWGEYEESSVLAGQPRKIFLDNVPDEPAARAWIVGYAKETLALTEEDAARYAGDVHFSSVWTEPRVNLNHLPDENTPAPGGMWPDDI